LWLEPLLIVGMKTSASFTNTMVDRLPILGTCDRFAITAMDINSQTRQMDKIIDLRFAEILMQKYQVQLLAVQLRVLALLQALDRLIHTAIPSTTLGLLKETFFSFLTPTRKSIATVELAPTLATLVLLCKTNKVIAVLASVKLLLMAMLHTTIVGLTTTMLLQAVFAGQRMVMPQIMEMSSSVQLIHSLVTHELVLCK
jgi:hypothetical protein